MIYSVGVEKYPKNMHFFYFLKNTCFGDISPTLYYKSHLFSLIFIRPGHFQFQPLFARLDATLLINVSPLFRKLTKTKVRIALRFSPFNTQQIVLHLLCHSKQNHWWNPYFFISCNIFFSVYHAANICNRKWKYISRQYPAYNSCFCWVGCSLFI